METIPGYVSKRVGKGPSERGKVPGRGGLTALDCPPPRELLAGAKHTVPPVTRGRCVCRPAPAAEPLPG